MGANQSQEQMLGPGPHVVYCKTCKEAKLSKIEYVNGSGWHFCVLWSIVWIMFSLGLLFNILSKEFTWDRFFKVSAFLLILGLFFLIPCCILPFFCNNCKDRKHYCTQCDTYIGKYNAASGQNNQMMFIYIPLSS